MELLFVNCCMRDPSVSRTHQLASAFLDAYQAAHPEDSVQELTLKQTGLLPMTAAETELRSQLIDAQEWDHPIFRFSKAFAAADQILIAAPYWDLSFPSLLKVYFESVCACNVAFRYEGDQVVGLCRAKSLTYLTTSGGFIGSSNFGLDYIRGLCSGLFGIETVHFLAVEGLDIDGLDHQARLQEGFASARQMAAALY
jgi:FMN-dependent NADH-azoreductase